MQCMPETLSKHPVGLCAHISSRYCSIACNWSVATEDCCSVLQGAAARVNPGGNSLQAQQAIWMQNKVQQPCERKTKWTFLSALN